MRIVTKISIALVAGSLLCVSATAQTPSKSANPDARKSFQEFRNSLITDFNNFRERLLEQYADFLNGEWHEYESLKGEVRDNTPKPVKVPTVKESPPTIPPIASDEEKGKAQKNPVAKPIIKEKPVVSEPVKQESPVDVDEFTFYGLPMSLPRVEYDIKKRIASPKEYGSTWNTLKNANIASKVVPELKKLAKEMNLNDYLLFRLTENYVNQKFPTAEPSARSSLTHFLLVNMGYDVRIAVTTSGRPLLLIPFKEKVFARTYMKIGNDRYYAFTPDDADITGEGILTCNLPSDGNLGEKFELRLSSLNIPQKPKSFKFEYGPISLTGEVNENLMPILYQYPQMSIENFAISEVSPELRKNLAAQMRSQLSSLEGDEKVETLLKFMHNVFEYATDEANHGFEKPYFLEETLYYPKNDCEDRAIFYTWFLWNALDREAQLITFPGHEAATVVMEKPINGAAYMYDGQKYYISDPTYIGSKTGMVMPNYRGMNPEVDYTYKY